MAGSRYLKIPAAKARFASFAVSEIAQIQQREHDVRAASAAWVAAFNAADVEALAALYLPDAVLWGTTSPVLIVGAQGIRHYFDEACGAEVKPTIGLKSEHVRVFGDVAVNSGSYRISRQPAPGQIDVLPARFSFVYRLAPAGWLITDHHSSVSPSN
jgi:uncharacterized protein (TIGR02246 family)